MTNFFATEMNTLYAVVCRDLMKAPQLIIRDSYVRERTNVSLCLQYPRMRIATASARALSLKYLAGEFAFYMGGSNTLSQIAHYGKFWKQVSDNGITVNSAYGKRLLFDENEHGFTQINYVMKCLLEDEYSRKAVAMIYNPEDAKNTKDNPCTIMLHFMIRHNCLHLTVYMRSNDAWLGLPYDLAFFTMLQELVWVRLITTKYYKLKLGTYEHLVGSLHLYEKHYDKADQVYANDCVPLIMPAMLPTTIAQMDEFLMYERHLRVAGSAVMETTDPFLNMLSGWLQ